MKITKDCYVTQKFARIAYKTNNIDACCAQLCHVATVEGLEHCFGSSARFQEGPHCYISRMDAERLGLANGELIEISSSVGSIQCEARIDETIPKGRVGIHFHFEQLLINKLFPTQFDEKTFTPNYKMTSVGIRKMLSA